MADNAKINLNANALRDRAAAEGISEDALRLLDSDALRRLVQQITDERVESAQGSRILSEKIAKDQSVKSAVEDLADQRIKASRRTLRQFISEVKTWIVMLLGGAALFSILSESVFKPYVRDAVNAYLNTDQRIQSVATDAAQKASWQIFTATSFFGQYQSEVDIAKCKEIIKKSSVDKLITGEATKGCYKIEKIQSKDSLLLPFVAEPSKKVEIELFVRQQQPIVSRCDQGVEENTDLTQGNVAFCISYQDVDPGDIENLDITLNGETLAMGAMIDAKPLEPSGNVVFAHFRHSIAKEPLVGGERILPIRSLKISGKELDGRPVSSTVYVVIRVLPSEVDQAKNP